MTEQTITERSTDDILRDFRLVRALETTGGAFTLAKNNFYFIVPDEANDLARSGHVKILPDVVARELIDGDVVEIPEHIRVIFTNTRPLDADVSGNDDGDGVSLQNYDSSGRFFTRAFEAAGLEYNSRTRMDEVKAAIDAAGWTGKAPSRKQLKAWLDEEKAASE